MIFWQIRMFWSLMTEISDLERKIVSLRRELREAEASVEIFKAILRKHKIDYSDE